MAKPTGRNITVDALNDRRLNAVKLRLLGVSVAQTAVRAGLSQPTVISAFKAYTRGGWAAVPVAPRGRGAGKWEVVVEWLERTPILNILA